MSIICTATTPKQIQFIHKHMDAFMHASLANLRKDNRLCFGLREAFSKLDGHSFNHRRVAHRRKYARMDIGDAHSWKRKIDFANSLA
mmetsp:Transcript_8652/g.24876  ORF Transcript_8652/g.24876 Transcript_8652/m.24876 type:complete len:87 (+) Transcript_8652:95-355(+)